MIRLLLRRDQGTDNLIMPVLIAGIASVVLRALGGHDESGVLFDPGNSGMVWFIQTFTVWSILLAGMIGSHYWLRSPQLHMALPLAARTLWLTRMTAICIGCGLMLFLISLINGVSWADDRGLFFIPTVWLGGLRVWSVFLLMLMLLQTPDPKRRKLETTPWYVAYTVILWSFGTVWLLLGPRGLWLTGPTLTIALMVGYNTWRHLPRTFLLESTGPDGTVLDDPFAPGPTEIVTSAPPECDTTPFPHNGDSPALMHGMLFRVMHNHWLGWLFMSVLTIYGLVLAIHYYRGDDPLMAMAYFLGLTFGSWNQSIQRIHAVDAWPISRRLIFAHALLPLVILYVAGLGLGIVINETKSTKQLLVHYENDQVVVPYEFREIAVDGIPPTLTTAWGETYTPKGTPVHAWSDAVIYNPYEIAHDTSTRFDAWQIDRAVAVVHGDPEPDPARYADLEVNSPDGAARECRGFDLQASRGRGSDLRAKTIALLIALFFLLGTPLLLMTTLNYDRRALDWVRTKSVLAGVFIPFGIVAVLLISPLFSETEIWAQASWLMITLRRFAESLPLSVTQYRLGVAAIGVLAYLVMQERFMRLEALHTLLKQELARNY